MLRVLRHLVSDLSSRRETGKKKKKRVKVPNFVKPVFVVKKLIVILTVLRIMLSICLQTSGYSKFCSVLICRRDK